MTLLEQSGQRIEGLPYWDVSDLPDQEQEELFGQVYRTGLSEGRTLVLDIGPADTLTPAEAAASIDNCLVLGVDIASLKEIEGEDFSFRTGKVNVGKLGRAMQDRVSLAAFFKLDAGRLGSLEYRFDRVQLVFPTPVEEEVEDLVTQAASLVKPGGEMVVFYEDALETVKGEDLERALQQKGLAAKLELMTPGQIKAVYGLTDSEFFDQEEVKVIKVRWK